MKPGAFGTMGAFESEESYLAALRELSREGFRGIDTFTPYAVEGEDQVLPRGRTPVGSVMLAAGAVGGAGGFALQWYAARDYPLNVGARPLNSWPAFIPVTFELTVLCAALAGVFALLVLCRLPRLDHPAFGDPRFARASQDRFFICLRSDAKGYSGTASREALLLAGASSVMEVRP
jgi:Protein of unknown function (DUF3341)